MTWVFPDSNLKWLQDRTLFVTLAGSHAYGTNHPESDEDFRGLVVPPKEYLLGFVERFEQSVFSEGIDCVIYGLHKFFKLAADCNPSIIEVLWADESLRVFSNKKYKKQIELLMENKDLFISKKAKHTFSGYAMSQLKRIKLHRKWFLNPPDKLTRQDFGLQDRPVVPMDFIKSALAAIQKRIDEWEFRELELLDPATRQVVMDAMAATLAEIEVGKDEKFMAAGRVLGMNDNWLDILDKERRYKNAKNERKQYENWRKNRNPARAEMERKYGLDLKHAVHLVRLLRMCEEILTTGQVFVKRPDAEELKAIMQGSMSYEEILEWAEAQDKKMNELYKISKLPNKPNFKRLDEICQEITESVLKGN